MGVYRNRASEEGGSRNSMTDIKMVRSVLRSVQMGSLEKMKEDEFDNPSLAAMVARETAGKHSLAEKLLRQLPDEEYESVKDYWAIHRTYNIIKDEGVDDLLVDSAHLPSQISRKMTEKRGKAVDAVKCRISRERDGDRIIFKDPVSKMVMNVELTGESTDGARVMKYREQFVNDIVDRGIDK